MGCVLLSVLLHVALIGNLPSQVDSIVLRDRSGMQAVSVDLLVPPPPIPLPSPSQSGRTTEPAAVQETPRRAARPSVPAGASRPAPTPSPMAQGPAPTPPTPPVFLAPRTLQPQSDELEGLGAEPPIAEAIRLEEEAGRPAALAEQTPPLVPERPRVSPPEARVQLDYRIFYEDYSSANRVAQLKLQFELDEDRYRLTTEARASGLMSWIWRGTLIQTSEGSIDSGGLVPHRYIERRAERVPRIATIDPKAATVRFGDGREIPAPAGTQDRLSVLLQIGLSLAALPQREPGTIFDLPLLASSRLEASRWRIEGEDVLEIGASTIVATRVKMLGSPGQSDGSIEIWFADGADPWPIRLRFSEPGGRTLDQIRELIR